MKAVSVCLFALLIGCGGKTDTGFGQECITIDGGQQCSTLGVCSTKNVWLQNDYLNVLSAPEIRLVFWGDFWFGNNQLGEMSREWNTLANDPAFYAPLNQYGVGAGSLSGIYNTNLNISPGIIDEGDIQQELQSEISNNALPADDSNSIYVVMLPSGVQAKNDTNVATGHHSYIHNVVYAVIEYNDATNMGVVASHEIYESATDPYFTGWNGGGEREVGDYCTKYDYELDSYTIQDVWGQEQCACNSFDGT